MARPAVTTLLKGRIVASREDYLRLVWTTVYQQECACGCRRPAESAHHLIGRGQGGDDVLANLVPLAGDGTRLCHGALTGKQRVHDDLTDTYISPVVVAVGIRGFIERRPEKRAYIVEHKSEAWLDRIYPEAA